MLGGMNESHSSSPKRRRLERVTGTKATLELVLVVGLVEVVLVLEVELLVMLTLGEVGTGDASSHLNFRKVKPSRIWFPADSDWQVKLLTLEQPFTTWVPFSNSVTSSTHLSSL